MTMTTVTKKNKFDFLLSPIGLLIGVVVGLLIGIFYPTWVPFVAPFGNIYLSVLKMCIGPILLTAISLNIGRLIQSNLGGAYLKRIFLITFGMFLAMSIAGVITATLAQPGKNLSEETLSKLGSIVNESKYLPDLEVELSKEYTLEEDSSQLIQFIMMMIPENIFAALVEGTNIKILFFSVLFGIAIGCLEKEMSTPFFIVIEATYLGISKIVKALMYLLPFGTAGLLAIQVSSVGVETLLAMTSFIQIMIGTYLLVFVIANLLIMYRSKKSLWSTILIMEKPMLIAFTTQASLACIPSGVISMVQGFSLDKRISGLLVPLGFTVFRFGNVLYFTIAGIFVAQLYNIDITIENIAILLLSSIFAGIATAGTSGILTLTMLSIVIEPMGLPLDAVIVLFIVVDPIIDPFRTLCTVHINLANTVLVVKGENTLDTESSNTVNQIT